MILTLFQLPIAGLNIFWLLLLLAVGFLALAYGGDILTSGAAAVSVNLKIAPIVVGLTVVSIATSMPEMATSLLAAKDNPGIALGNILGSNLANMALILGISAVIVPLRAEHGLISREVRILILMTVIFFLCAMGGGFHQAEGLFLLSLTVLYLIHVIRGAKSKDAIEQFTEGNEGIARKTTKAAVFFILFGGLLLALGAELLVGASVEMAMLMGASELFVGLTIVAIGTSLPELAASVAALRAGHGHICAGNIVGSSIFNMLLIGGGVSAYVGMDVRDELLLIEFPALLLLSCLLLWFFKTDHVVSRREGVSLLFLYVGILSLSAFSQFGYLF
jgi:cation:H+ antiporter